MKNLLKYIIILAIFMATGCSTSQFYNMESKEFDEIDYQFKVEKEKVRNIELAYIDEGSGDQTFLLIHGLGSNAKGWLKNITELAQHGRVLAIDLPGYGKSDKEYYKYSLEFYADVLTQFLTLKDIEKAVFVGHSMGGQISMITSMKYPERVEKLVLISPAGFEKFDDGEGAWMKKVMTVELIQDTPTRNIDMNLRSNFYDTPDEALFMVTDRIQIKGAKDFEKYCYAVSKNVTSMIDEPVWDKLELISHPTLIIFGENDGLIPNPYLHGGNTVTIGNIGKETIPDSKLVMIPKCGHFAQFEKYEIVNQEIIDFIKE